MIPTHTEPNHRVLCGSSLAGFDMPEGEPIADHLIVDPPYSERTHKGHDSQQRRDPATMFSDQTGGPRATKVGRPVNYECWGNNDVILAVNLWEPLTRGWFVVMSDHVLAPIWAAVLGAHDRYVFAPLPFVSKGSRVRLAGDGPSSWTTWITVARPRHEPYSKWGTLPGAYSAKPERMPVVGGKPLALMRQLVRDYSREGDTVWDPCCGGGTTLVAAKELGRSSIGMDLDRAHCEIAGERLRKTQQTMMKFPAAPRGVQGELI